MQFYIDFILELLFKNDLYFVELYIFKFQVGDQIIRIKGCPVEDATHKEVLQLNLGQNSINFKVKCKFLKSFTFIFSNCCHSRHCVCVI